MNFDRTSYYVGVFLGSLTGMFFGSWISYFGFLVVILIFWILLEAMGR
jgi:hypothetical protein